MALNAGKGDSWDSLRGSLNLAAALKLEYQNSELISMTVGVTDL